MGTFITGPDALPAAKTDHPDLTYHGYTYELGATDINSIWAALADVRTQILSVAPGVTSGAQAFTGAKTFSGAATPVTLSGSDTTGNGPTLSLINNAGGFGVPVVEFTHGGVDVGALVGNNGSVTGVGLVTGLSLSVGAGKQIGFRVNSTSIGTFSAAGLTVANVYATTVHFADGSSQTSAASVSAPVAVTSSASPYTITSGDLFVCDTTTGDVQVNLPALSSPAGAAGRSYTIKRTDAGSFDLTVVADGADLIEGGFSSLDLNKPFDWYTLESDGAKWWVRAQSSTHVPALVVDSTLTVGGGVSFGDISTAGYLTVEGLTTLGDLYLGGALSFADRAAALNALLPSQSSASGKVLQTDGTNASWVTGGGGGGTDPFTSTAASGSDAIQLTTGQRAHLGGGTNDYLRSDGTGLVTPGSFQADAIYAGPSGFHVAGFGVLTDIGSYKLRLQGYTNDTSTSVGVTIDSGGALTTAGSKVVSFGNNGTEVADIDYLGGGHFNAASSFTGGGVVPVVITNSDATGTYGQLVLNNTGGTGSLAAIGLQIGGVQKAAIIAYSAALFGLQDGVSLSVGSGQAIGLRVNGACIAKADGSGFSADLMLPTALSVNGAGTSFKFQVATGGNGKVYAAPGVSGLVPTLTVDNTAGVVCGMYAGTGGYGNIFDGTAPFFWAIDSAANLRAGVALTAASVSMMLATSKNLVVGGSSTDNGQKLQVGGNFAFTARHAAADADYTVTAADYVVAYTSISAARAVALPAAASGNDGQEVVVVDESGSCSGTNTITVGSVAGGSVVLGAAYAFARVRSNGSAWVRVG